MTDHEEIEIGKALSFMEQGYGYKLLGAHIKDEIKDALDKFIALPPEAMSSFAAFQCKATINALNSLTDWVAFKIKAGEQAEIILKKEEKYANAK